MSDQAEGAHGNLGPGFLVTAAFIGPGTILTASRAGAEFGLSLLWALLFSLVMTFVLQEMALRLGLIKRLALTTILRDAVTQPCLLYTSPSPRDGLLSRMPSSA